MECGGAVYARVPAGGLAALEDAIQRVRDPRWPGRGPLGVLACTLGQHDLALVDRWGKSDDMPRWAEGPDLSRAEELAALSQEVGEVIGYYDIEDGDQVLVYGHWKDGTLGRALCALEREWTHVQGTPEPWETDLFSSKALERALSAAQDDEQDEAPVRAAFESGRLTQGARWPRPAVIGALSKALRLPTYGSQPWPRRADAVKKLEA